MKHYNSLEEYQRETKHEAINEGPSRAISGDSSSNFQPGKVRIKETLSVRKTPYGERFAAYFKGDVIEVTDFKDGFYKTAKGWIEAKYTEKV